MACMPYKGGMGELTNRIREARSARGMTASALASRVAISRQALAAIESGRSTPSAVIALKIAAALGSSVEALFTVTPPALIPIRPASAGVRVVMGEVDGRWVAHSLPPDSREGADGIGTEDGTIEPLVDPSRLRNHVLVAGCAPVLGALTAHVSESGSVGARWLMRTSREAIAALAAGEAHIAGLHLAGLDDPGAHDRLLREAFPGEELDVIRLVGWREGLATLPSNPRGVRTIDDLRRSEVRVGLRAPGSGAAKALEDALGGEPLTNLESRGMPVGSHLEAAQAVARGAVDGAVLIEPVAEAHGLDFVPLSEERFELVVRRRHREHPGVMQLLAHLCTAGFSREVRSMGAYDTAHMGAERRVGSR